MPGSSERRGATVVITVAMSFAVLATAASCVADIRLRQGVDAADDGRVGDAVASFASAHRWHPWDSDVEMIGAQAHAEITTTGTKANARETSALAERSLARTPESHDALVSLGIGQLRLGQFSGATGTLDRAVRLAPNRPDAYVQRAISRVGIGDRAGAVADLDRAPQLAPRSAVAHRLRDRLG